MGRLLAITQPWVFICLRNASLQGGLDIAFLNKNVIDTIIDAPQFPLLPIHQALSSPTFTTLLTAF